MKYALEFSITVQRFLSWIMFCFCNPYLQQVFIFQIFELKQFHWYPYPHMKETYSKTNQWIHFQMTSIKENAYFRLFPIIYIFGDIVHYNALVNLGISFLHRYSQIRLQLCDIDLWFILPFIYSDVKKPDNIHEFKIHLMSKTYVFKHVEIMIIYLHDLLCLLGASCKRDSHWHTDTSKMAWTIQLIWIYSNTIYMISE